MGRWWRELNSPHACYHILIQTTIRKRRLYKFIGVAYSQPLFDGDYENEDRVDGNDDAAFDDDDDDDGDDKYLPNGKPKRCGRIEGNNPALLRHNNNTTLETLNLSGLGRSTGTAGIIDAGWTATFQLQWDPNSALEKLRLLKNSFFAD